MNQKKKNNKYFNKKKKKKKKHSQKEIFQAYQISQSETLPSLNDHQIFHNSAEGALWQPRRPLFWK